MLSETGDAEAMHEIGRDLIWSALLGDAKSEAIRRTEKLVGEIHRDREIRGLDVTDLPSVSDEILDPLNLCKE